MQSLSRSGIDNAPDRSEWGTYGIPGAAHLLRHILNMTKPSKEEAIDQFKKVERDHAQMGRELKDFRRTPTWRDTT